MRKLLGATALFIVFTSMPLLASGQTSVNTNVNTNTNASSLAAQAEALLQQIAALQAQLAAQTGGTSVSGTGSAPATAVSSANCPLIGRVLRLGSTGDDVSRLQRFLAVDPSIYPEAQITGYYGSLTEAAVKRWQTRFNIVSSGDAATTGFGVTGPRTAAAISLQCSTYLSGGTTGTPATPSVGGFIQVTPISGNAPLTTQVVATVNTVNSCQAATYTLDWGDTTVPQTISVPAGRCGTLQQTFTHSYIYGGAYLVKLSAGEHSTTATVVVYGAGAPTTPATPTTGTPLIALSAPSGQSITAGQNLNITWSSQNAPAGSKVRLEVYKSGDATITGNNDRGLASNTSELPVSGSYTWATPSNGAMLADAGYGGYALTPGTYRIAAKLYSGGNCWGYCSGNTARTIHATAQSGTFTVTSGSTGGNFSYAPLTVTSFVDNTPLKTGATFNLMCSGDSYTLNWGDGSVTDNIGSGACANNPVTRSHTHTYTQAGAYTITLKRGNNFSQVDTASIVISN